MFKLALNKLNRLPLNTIVTKNFSSTSSAALVKALREKTGAPMMDCKKALDAEEVKGDVEKAVEWLRKKGIARASSNANRTAMEGLIALQRSANSATLAEVNSETDFVARNQEFQKFVVNIVNTASSLGKVGDVNIAVDSLIQTKPVDTPALASIQDALGEAVSKIRENLVIRRASYVNQDADTILGAYVHGKISSDVIPENIQLGRSASVVRLRISPKIEDAQKLEKVNEVARKLAMHIVASKPMYLRVQDVPEELIAKEKAIFREASANEKGNKSPEVMERIIQGKVNKRLSEFCLIEQNHMAEEGAPVVGKFLESFSKQVGHDIKIDTYQLWQLGSSQTTN